MLNNIIDTTTDDYYLNPYKFNKSNSINKHKILSDSNKNLNHILKSLTSIIMNNDDLNIIEIDNYENNETNETNETDETDNIIKINKTNKIINYDKFIVFKLVANNNIDKLTNLLSNNKSLDINIQDLDGDTALHIAIFISNYDACNILINSNANIFIRDKWGQTPLHRICFAIQNPNLIKIINLINNKQLKYPNNIFNSLDKFNNTPLHLVVKYILKNKINLDKHILHILQKLISLTDIDLINDDGISCRDLLNMLGLSV